MLLRGASSTHLHPDSPVHCGALRSFILRRLQVQASTRGESAPATQVTNRAQTTREFETNACCAVMGVAAVCISAHSRASSAQSGSMIPCAYFSKNAAAHIGQSTASIQYGAEHLAVGLATTRHIHGAAANRLLVHAPDSNSP